MFLSNSSSLSKNCPSSNLLINSTMCLSTKYLESLKHLSDSINRAVMSAFEISVNMVRKRGIYSVIEMKASGLRYTDEGDTAICKDCGIKLSNWTSDEKPFARHANESPDCPYVKSLRVDVSKFVLKNVSQSSSDDDQPFKKQKMDVEENSISIKPLVETGLMKQVRQRTFSHWSKEMKPSPVQFIHAGFFGCNVGDRVICVYCNLICQQWSAMDDDPFVIHKTISPNCVFVKAIEQQGQQSAIVIVNNQNGDGQEENAANVEPLRWDDFASTSACHPNYAELYRRESSFSSWPTEGLPSVDSLVRAGFFYAGTKTIVTCFYCNGSLQNWGAKDDPKIEHARWFPSCAYAKQLCGKELHDRIQATKRAQQEQRNRTNNSVETNGSSSSQGSVRGMIDPSNEGLLSRYVAARLDLPASQRMFDYSFKISVVKRCWEDQIRLKRDDFVDFCDLWMACTILQKQIDHISGKKENITIPSVAMQKIRERGRAIHETPAEVPVTTASIPITTAEMTNASINSTTSTSSSTTGEKMKIDQTNSGDANLCFLCLEDQRRLACMPCGHLVACVPCGHSLRSCPICRRDIEAFVRIYL